MNYSIDTYAWIEYFRGTSKGKKAKRYVESKKAITPSIVIAETGKKLLKETELGNENMKGAEKKLEFIRAHSEIADLDFDLAKDAARIDLEMKKLVKGWGMADSIILATAKKYKGKVVTGDSHFRDVKEAIMIIK